MRKEIMFVFLCFLIINNFTIEAINVSEKSNGLFVENKDTKFIQLTQDELNKLNEFFMNVKDLETKRKIQEILNLIINNEGKLNIEFAKKLALKYYTEVSTKIVFNDTTVFKINNTCDYLKINSSIAFMNKGTSTVFMAPYSDCFSWGEKTMGIEEYAHGCNKESGSIGAYANTFVGGATAEAMQQLNFYIGRTKAIKIDAEIIRTGGKATFGFAAFAGTEKTWSWDDFQSNYHRADVDAWWNWDEVTFKIINLVTILIGYAPTNIYQAITLLNQIVNFKAFANQMNDMIANDDAEIIHIQFNISLTPGYHSIWVGLRATASACLTGTGSAVTMGQVSQITIDGIAAPSKPNINGPSSGKTGTYTFSFASTDPNNDKIQYKINWGDAEVYEYTDFYNSEEVSYKTHNYDKEGTYNIKVKAIDIDKMESQDFGTHLIKIDNNKCRFLVNKKIVFSDFTFKNILSKFISDFIF